jgi:hypothetical protein
VRQVAQHNLATESAPSRSTAFKRRSGCSY